MKPFKRLLFVVCFCLIPFFCIACAKTAPEPAATETQAVNTETQTVDTESQTADTETQPVEIDQVSVLDSLDIRWAGEAKTYTAGSELTLDASGRIGQVTKRYEKLECAYNENGLITKVTITRSDNSTGYETWTYEGSAPVSGDYEPNNYRSAKDIVYSAKTDDEGRITEILEDITLTSAEDGSVSEKNDRYIYAYDADGRVASIDYYSDGKHDHTTTLTYDENGDLSVYSSRGSDQTEYLRVAFTYKTVDADSVSTAKADPFVTAFNFDRLLNHIL